MELIENSSATDKIEAGCVLTIGNFDGVHKGHQQILGEAAAAAAERDKALVAMTFEPHPVAILYPEKAPGVLAPLEMKAALLAANGVDYLVVLKDSRELLDMVPADFVDRFLVKHLEPSLVVEGDDFNFGSDRAGSVETLRELGKQRGFDVKIVKQKSIELSTGQKVRVSSTIIRYMLESGHVVDAASLLGRPYRLMERIVSGRGKGREIGFPTLNLKEPQQIIPAEGVYTGWVSIGESPENLYTGRCRKRAVFSIGQARTFGDEYPLLIEAHLLGEKADKSIGKWMAMDFAEHIRTQHKFRSETELARQISEDCRRAESILKQFEANFARK